MWLFEGKFRRPKIWRLKYLSSLQQIDIMDCSPKSANLPDANSTEGQNRSGLGSHKRSLSGSLFSKLGFLRPGGADPMFTPVASAADNHTASFNTLPSSPPRTAMSFVVSGQQKKTRKRKGSLRKTALL